MELFRLAGNIFINADEANKNIESVDKKAEGLGSKLGGLAGIAGKAALGFAAVGAAAVGGMAVKGVMAVDDMQKALNGLQASTGFSDDYMQEFKGTMLDIYSNNFGESFEDIGKSMSTIGQQTGATGDELKNMTTSALALRDTFEFEVNESTRSAKMLMDQFGLSSKDAYNLIAQGAQMGLDKNGDLLDTINEYSVQFKQLGLSSEEMFNMLINGSATGTFSVDKLGDAVKEFGIRAKDGSKGTMEAFTSLGLDANKLSMDFAKGGEQGKKAFELVTQKLLAMKDPLAQNATGTALFGSMWEDLGAKGIEALTDIKGETTLTYDALKKINEVKYNTFGEAMTGIGRQLETGILIPLGEKILPILNKFANVISQNMPMIKGVIGGTMDSIGKIFNSIGPIIEDAVEYVSFFVDGINNAGDPEALIGTWGYSFWQLGETVRTILPMIGSFFKTAFAVVQDVIKFVVTNVLPPLINIITFIMTEIVPQLVKQFQIWIPKIVDVFKELWMALLPVINAVIKAFKDAWPVIKFVMDLIGVNISILLTTLKGMVQFISGVLTGDWSKAWNGIKSIFVGVWNAIYAQFKNVIDPIAAKIKWLKDAFGGFISKVTSFKMPSFSIPGFATGGIVTRPTLAMVGEGGESEAILPLSKLNKLMSNGNGKGNITFNITGNTIASDYDVDRLMNRAMSQLRYEGVY